MFKINGREVNVNEYYFYCKEDGIYQVYYTNGALRYEDSILNRRPHGIQRGWYEDGTPRYEFDYLNGRRHGLQRGWHEDRTLEYEEIYVNGIDRTEDFINNKLAQVVIFGRVIQENDNELQRSS